jgi:hypothetical protein
MHIVRGATQLFEETMRFLLTRTIALLLASTVPFYAAHADAIYSWTFSGNAYPAPSSYAASGQPNELILARAYQTSNDSGTGNFQSATLGLYGGGLGITATDDSGSPNHAIDNAGRDNFLLLEFDSNLHRLTSFSIGWHQNDSDVQIWVGGPTAAGLNLALANGCSGHNCTVADFAALGFVQLPLFSNAQDFVSNPVNTATLGRYVLIAGQLGSDQDDYFKLYNVTNVEVTVPEPATLGVMLAGLAGLLAARRRRGSRSRRDTRMA